MNEYTVTVTVEVEVTLTVEAVSAAKAAKLAGDWTEEAAGRMAWTMPHVEVSDISPSTPEVSEIYDEDGEPVEWDG